MSHTSLSLRLLTNSFAEEEYMSDNYESQEAATQYFGNFDIIFSEDYSYIEKSRRELLALPMLHAAKYLPAAQSNSLRFKLDETALFGFFIEDYPEDIWKNMDVALQQIKVDFGKQTYLVELTDIMGVVRECLDHHFIDEHNSSFCGLIDLILSRFEEAPWDGLELECGNILDGLELESVDILADLELECSPVCNDIIEDLVPAQGELSSITENTVAKFSAEISNPSPQHQVNDTKSCTAGSIKKLIESSDKGVLALLKQFCWVACTESVRQNTLSQTLNPLQQNEKENSNTKGGEQALTKIDQKLFLSALFGCREMLERLAAVLGVNPVDIVFPADICEQRKLLAQSVQSRTFEDSVTNGRVDIDWFKKSETYLPYLRLDFDVALFLGILVSENYEDVIKSQLRDLLLPKMLPEIGADSYITQFLRTNIENQPSRVDKYKALTDIRKHLDKEVLGQSKAVDSVYDHLSTMLLENAKNHLGISTFFGESGTGKTFLAENIAIALNDYLNYGFQCSLFNMEQYSNERDVMKLFGTGSQYANSALGEITTLVAQYPRQIIVFDEIEKAHSTVVQSLLTLIDKGQIQDRTTMKTIDFSQCYFVFTTNLGSEIVNRYGNNNIEINISEVLSDARNTTSLSPEMVNRLSSGNIALFKTLEAKHLIKMAIQEFERHEGQQNIGWQNNCPELILKTLGGQASPRNIKSQINKLTSKILKGAMARLDESEYQKLEHITVKQERKKQETSNLVFFSNDMAFSKILLSSKMVVKEAHNIETIINELKGPSDGYIFDEESLSVDQRELAAVLNQYDNKVFYTMNSGKNTTCLTSCLSSSVLYREFIVKNRSSAEITNVVKTINKHTQLINTTHENITKRKNVHYDIQLDVTETGIHACFNNFTYVNSICQDDLALPFLNFDGAPSISFKDIVGLESAKARLNLVINAMTSCDTLKEQNISIPKGYVLSGHPGTGKTMLAKALANECGLAFFNVNSADLLVGNVVENINKLFDVLEKQAPAILNLDEIDAIAQCRTRSSNAIRIAVNTLLSRLDGFHQSDLQIFVLAATNHPSLLDPALLRSGRLEKVIHCDTPSSEQRKHFIEKRLNISKKQITENTLSELTLMTSGCTIAVLEHLIRESFYEAIETDKSWSESLLIAQLRNAKFGKINDFKQDTPQLKTTAYHEAGHLVAHKLLMPDITIEYATIQPRGAALGMIVPGENDSSSGITDCKVKHLLQVLLAGMAAENVLKNETEYRSAGASNDREKATNLAKNAIVKWGLSNRFGLAIPSEIGISQQELTEEVNVWLNDAYHSVLALLKQEYTLLDRVAQALLTKESLDSKEIDEIFTPIDNQSGIALVS